MKVIVPMPVTEVSLVFTNITEDDAPVWAAGTTYAAGAKVILTATHRVYESVSAGNVGHPPASDDGTFWLDLGATNRWRAFDKSVGARTTRAGVIRYDIDCVTKVTGIALMNLSASSVRVRILDSAGVEIYDETKAMTDTSELVDWFAYFTSELEFETETIMSDLPGYAGNTIQIYIGEGDASAGVGEIIIGKVVSLGETLDGTSIGIEDYSTKERDDFGNTYLVERGFTDTVSFQVAVAYHDARRVKRVLAGLRATPAVYFSGEETQGFGAFAFGIFQDFDIPLVSAGVSFATFEIEGLI